MEETANPLAQPITDRVPHRQGLMASLDSCCLALSKPSAEVYYPSGCRCPQSSDNRADSRLTDSQPSTQVPQSAPNQLQWSFSLVLCLGFPSRRNGSPKLLI